MKGKESTKATPRFNARAQAQSPIQAQLFPTKSNTRYVPPPTLPRRQRIPIFSRHSIGRIVAGGIGGLTLVYASLVIHNLRQEKERIDQLDVPDDTSERYNHNAWRFDGFTDAGERALGMGWKRRSLLSHARGHVLETSVGTGKNMKYFPLERDVKSVTMVDKSREMIEVARLKWPEEGNAWFINAAFRVQDAAEKVPCPSKNGFDTIVQTIGLCSTSEPEKLLRNMAEMTNPDGGRILLLEHGIGTWRLINWCLNWSAKVQAHKYGCWHNKDIGAIVERSGLEVVEAKRFNFGTTWWYVLKPAQKRAEGEGQKLVQEDVIAPKPQSWGITLSAWLQ